MADGDWQDPETRAVALLLNDQVEQALIFFNAHYEPVEFTLPSDETCPRWRILVDTVQRHDRAGRRTAERRREGRRRTARAARAGRERLMQRSATGFWGGHLLADGRAAFGIWAPGQEHMALRLAGRDHRMEPRGDGWWTLEVENAGAGMEYMFVRPDGMAVPDPASRAQAGDVHGPSVLTDPRALSLEDAGLAGAPMGRGRHLRAPCRHLHAGGHVPGGDRAARPPRGARRHRDRDHAGRPVRRQSRLGI